MYLSRKDGATLGYAKESDEKMSKGKPVRQPQSSDMATGHPHRGAQEIKPG